MDKDRLEEKEKAQEHELLKNKLEEDSKVAHRKPHDMPGQFEGRGPQENSMLGYDALEDI